MAVNLIKTEAFFKNLQGVHSPSSQVSLPKTLHLLANENRRVSSWVLLYDVWSRVIIKGAWIEVRRARVTCVRDLNCYPCGFLRPDPVLFCQQYPHHIWKIALNGVVVLKSRTSIIVIIISYTDRASGRAAQQSADIVL